MKNTTGIICHAVACILAVEGADAASGSSLLGALFRPLDALNLHSALNPSNLLHGDRSSFGTEQRQFLPKQGDMSLLDSTNTFELLSTLRQGRSTLTDYLQGRTTGFSSQKFTIVSALFGDDAADQRLRDALGPVSEHGT